MYLCFFLAPLFAILMQAELIIPTEVLGIKLSSITTLMSNYSYSLHLGHFAIAILGLGFIVRHAIKACYKHIIGREGNIKKMWFAS